MLETKKIIFKNTLWLSFSEVIVRFLKFILIVWLARLLGPTEYGKFSFALNFITFFAVFSDFGISTIITREFSKTPKKPNQQFASLFALKTFLLLFSLFLINFLGFFIAPSFELKKLIFILSFYGIFSSFFDFFNAFFRAYQKMEYEALGKILNALLVTLAGFFVLFYFPSLQNLGFVYFLAIFLTTIFSFFILKEKFSFSGFKIEKKIWKETLFLAWPLAVVSFLGSIYHYLDSIMLGAWGFLKENGYYSAAYRILDFSIIPGFLISLSFFPELSRSFLEKKEKKVFLSFLSLITILAVPLVFGGIFLAEKIIIFFFGQEYQPSVLALKILILSSFLIYFSFPFSRLLIAADLQKNYFFITLWGAILNIFLNLFLIPRFTLYGASIATFLSYLLVIFLAISFLKKRKQLFYDKNYFYLLVFSVISASLMVLFLSFLKLNVIILVFLGIIFYFLFLWFFIRYFKIKIF